MFFKTLACLSLCSVAVLASPTKFSIQERASSDKIRGINLGGWLVLEPWITPSIFQKHPGPIDEYTLTRKLGSKARPLLTKHWDSWIKAEDFEKVASAGFNTVRIPVGYWSYKKVPGDPYLQGAAPYVDKAIVWAKRAGLKVWIDLHGAPGSQNGYDNSGQKTDNIAFQQGNNVQHTLEVLQIISKKYASNPTVSAIEILNEPLGVRLDENNLRQFTRDGYGKIRERSSSVSAVFHDAFSPVSEYNGFLTPSDRNAQNVIVDHHEYQVFTDEMNHWSHNEHIGKVCDLRSSYTGSDKDVVVGEWSPAMTDCAAALNGLGVGARYEGLYKDSTRVGSCSKINFIETWDQTLKDDTRRYIAAQLEAYECSTRGYFMWTLKTEASPEWDFLKLQKAGVFPPLGGVVCGAYCPNPATS
ncbi:MAG: hypothetical protein M1825_000495 [Sarcosagium campestre]|nr:MAG: hypothetical protein M1825_000495 [Sarcosagium campestre]